MLNFSKLVTMNWDTTCDIPFKRYFLGSVINYINMDREGHSHLRVRSVQTKKKKKFLLFVHIGYTPKLYGLICSFQCIACCKISTGPLMYKGKNSQKFEGW